MFSLLVFIIWINNKKNKRDNVMGRLLCDHLLQIHANGNWISFSIDFNRSSNHIENDMVTSF